LYDMKDVKVTQVVNQNAPKTKSFTFLGTTYALTYDKTEKYSNQPGTRDEYTSKNGAQFAFESTTGQLLFVGSISDVPYNATAKLSRQVLIDKANGILKTYFPEYKAYTISDVTMNDSGKMAYISYSRYIGGYETSDDAMINFHYTGDLDSYIVRPGMFSGVKVPAFNEQTQVAQITALIKQTYGDGYVSSTVSGKYLDKDESGNLQMKYTFDVKYRPNGGPAIGGRETYYFYL